MKNTVFKLTLALLLLASVKAFAVLPAGTAGDPIIDGGQFNTTAPALAPGATSPLQMDSSGRVIVANQASSSTFTLSGTSPASASTVVGASITGLAGYRSLNIAATLTGATGGVLDIYLQVSPDGGTTWVDYAHFTQLAAGAAVSTKVFTVTREAQQTTITAVGTGTTPALAAGSVIGGNFTDRMRVLYVAGASTTAGAAQTILVYAGS